MCVYGKWVAFFINQINHLHFWFLHVHRRNKVVLFILCIFPSQQSSYKEEDKKSINKAGRIGILRSKQTNILFILCICTQFTESREEANDAVADINYTITGE